VIKFQDRTMKVILHKLSLFSDYRFPDNTTFMLTHKKPTCSVSLSFEMSPVNQIWNYLGSAEKLFIATEWLNVNSPQCSLQNWGI